MRYGCVRGGIVAIWREAGRGKKGKCRPNFGNIGADGAIKKPRQAWGLAVGGGGCLVFIGGLYSNAYIFYRSCFIQKIS